jgi:hypothetical protein
LELGLREDRRYRLAVRRDGSQVEEPGQAVLLVAKRRGLAQLNFQQNLRRGHVQDLDGNLYKMVIFTTDLV